GERPMRLGPTIEPELALVVACLRWPQDDAAREAIRSCAGAALDWNQFLSQVARHRVVSLVSQALLSAGSPFVPTAVTDRLRSEARAWVRTTLDQIAETVRLTRFL